MAKKRGRKTSRMDAVATTAGSTLGSIANQLDALNRKRNALSDQIRGLLRRAESKLKGMTARGRKSAKKAAPKKRSKLSTKAKKGKAKPR